MCTTWRTTTSVLCVYYTTWPTMCTTWPTTTSVLCVQHGSLLLVYYVLLLVYHVYILAHYY